MKSDNTETELQSTLHTVHRQCAVVLMPKPRALSSVCIWRVDVGRLSIEASHGHRVGRGKCVMPDEVEPEPETEPAVHSVAMLKAVIDGGTYEAVAAAFGVTRTAVERRIKIVAMQLCEAVGIEGLNAGGTAFVRRLRQHRNAILEALVDFEPPAPFGPRETRVVSGEEIIRAAQRVKSRSLRPWHDLSLFYMLFATGARPLEIARFEVRDYLNADGTVRRESEVRAAVAITGKARPMYFNCTRLDDALAPYLMERRDQKLGLGLSAQYRSLDPQSRLFLSPIGEGFKITPYGQPGQQRFLCRPILEAYRKLFRYSELRDVTPLSVRHTVASRLYDRGADDEQVGLLLGISDPSAVRELFPRPRAPLATLVEDLI